MFGLFHHKKDKHGQHGQTYHPPAAPPPSPPKWAPAPELSYTEGKFADAPENEYRDAERVCKIYPPEPPRLLPSDVVDRINIEGGKVWGLEFPAGPRFQGQVININSGQEKRGPAVVQVMTRPDCGGVSLLSNLPIMAGLYELQGKTGVYYEIMIQRMNGIIAVGELLSFVNSSPARIDCMSRINLPPLSLLALSGLESPQRRPAPR